MVVGRKRSTNWMPALFEAQLFSFVNLPDNQVKG